MRRWLDQLLARLGIRHANDANRRCKKKHTKVHFKPHVSVLEFERQLFGGGGVPDADCVSLGLGPRLVTHASATLGDKATKDEYACSGFLEEQRRAELLSEWASKPKLRSQLERVVSPELERTRRERSESAASRKDQRRTPISEAEALKSAQRDAAFAKRVAAQWPSPDRRSSPRKPALSTDARRGRLAITKRRRGVIH